MTSTLVVFLQGVCAATAGAVGLLFLQFWRDTKDRLFAFFALAFWLMALSWVVLGMFSPTEESRPYVYGLRLLAFVLIITATIDKSRKR